MVQRSLYDFSRVNGRTVNRSVEHRFEGDDAVTCMKEQTTEDFSLMAAELALQVARGVIW